MGLPRKSARTRTAYLAYAFEDNPLDRLLKIDVEARYTLPNTPRFVDRDDPALVVYQAGYNNPLRFFTRKITAYMPIGITDYVRWITNLNGSTDPAVVGTGLSFPLNTVDHLASNSAGVSVLYPDVALNSASNLAFNVTATCYSCL